MTVARGHGRVEVELQGSRGVVTRSLARSPLQLFNPRNHGRAAWIYQSSHGGGFVDGDEVALDVQVGERAGAVLLTQASTKAYRATDGASAGSRQTTRLDVRAGATCLSIPDPVVCFAGSRFSQKLELNLGAGASAVVTDFVCSGRVESGERWELDSYRSRVDVRRAGQTLFREVLQLEPGVGGALTGRFGAYNVVGIVLLFGPEFEPAFEGGGRERLERAAFGARARALVSASKLPHEGVVVRIAADSTETSARLVRECLGDLTESIGDDPWSRRW